MRPSTLRLASLVGFAFVLLLASTAEAQLAAGDGQCAAESGLEALLAPVEAGTSEEAIEAGTPEPILLSGCASYCMQARRDCSNSCWTGSGEAVFSCGPDGAGGCQSTCTCCEYPFCNGP